MNFEKTTPRVRGWLDNAHTVLKAAVLPYWNADPAALRDPISDANPKIDFIFKFNNKDRSVDSTFVTAKGTSTCPVSSSIPMILFPLSYFLLILW